MKIDLPRLEEMVDKSVACQLIEAQLPSTGRPRQLSGRTLMLGILLASADGRPAHMTRVLDALVSLPGTQRRRLGVEVEGRRSSHLLTYRQIEHTTSVLRRAMPACDGGPAEALVEIVAALLSASVPERYAMGSPDVAVDWSDVDTFARMAREGEVAADTDAFFGHRRGNSPGESDERFFGYYMQFATMVTPLGGEPRPELVLAMSLSSPRLDPPAVFVPVLRRLAAERGIGDVIYDIGYSYRQAVNWALPLRAMGASLVADLHPNDRGTKGTFAGAVVANGSLYCPRTPSQLLGLGPLPRNCGPEALEAHHVLADELGRYRLSPITRHDADGYHRVGCPAVAGQLRCALWEKSLSRSFDKPEVIDPPAQSPPKCCTQATITVPASVAAKTAQRHEYLSRVWAKSYSRRSAAERTNATLKDPARTDVGKGWCRLMDLPGMTLFLVCAVVVRNMRIVDSFEAMPPEKRDARRTRARRRVTTGQLAAGTVKAPP